jgi:hypothetical protein
MSASISVKPARALAHPETHVRRSLRLYDAHIHAYGSSGKIFSLSGWKVDFHYTSSFKSHEYQDHCVVLMMRLSLSA